MDNHIESKFICHFCNKVFSQKFNLQRHFNEKRCKSKAINNIIEINNVINYQKQKYNEEIEKYKQDIEKYKQETDIFKQLTDFTISDNSFNIYITINPDIKKSIDFNKLKESINKTIEKSCKVNKTTKKFVFPSGKSVSYQGYENIALNELLTLYKEENIENDRKYIPNIKYKLNNKQHYYYPDIYIKSENLIIEVKSTWTYKNDLIKNINKALAVRKAGYKFEFWIYNNKKYKIII